MVSPAPLRGVKRFISCALRKRFEMKDFILDLRIFAAEANSAG
jgi:hypothetical protein